MSNRILVDGTKAAGKQVLEFVNDVMEVLAKGRRLKVQLESMSTNDTFNQVEVETGCQAGQGQNVFGIISTAVNQIDSPQVMEMKRLDQG